MSTVPAGSPGLSSALRQTVELLSRRWFAFLAIAPIYWVPNLLHTFSPFPTFENALSGHRYLSELGGLFDLGILILIATPYQVAVLHWFLHDVGRQPFAFVRVYRKTAELLFPVMVLNSVYLFLFMAGLLLFIVPGLFVLVGLSLAPAAYVFERDGIMGSIHRSWELSRGYRWRLLAIVAGTMAASEAVQAILLKDPYQFITFKSTETDVVVGLLYHLADWVIAMVSTSLFAVFYQQISAADQRGS